MRAIKGDGGGRGVRICEAFLLSLTRLVVRLGVQEGRSGKSGAWVWIAPLQHENAFYAFHHSAKKREDWMSLLSFCARFGSAVGASKWLDRLGIELDQSAMLVHPFHKMLSVLDVQNLLQTLPAAPWSAKFNSHFKTVHLFSLPLPIDLFEADEMRAFWDRLFTHLLIEPSRHHLFQSLAIRKWLWRTVGLSTAPRAKRPWQFPHNVAPALPDENFQQIVCENGYSHFNECLKALYPDDVVWPNVRMTFVGGRRLPQEEEEEEEVQGSFIPPSPETICIDDDYDDQRTSGIADTVDGCLSEGKAPKKKRKDILDPYEREFLKLTPLKREGIRQRKRRERKAIDGPRKRRPPPKKKRAPPGPKTRTSPRKLVKWSKNKSLSISQDPLALEDDPPPHEETRRDQETHNPLPDQPQEERSIDVHPGGKHVPLSFSIEMRSPELPHPVEMTHAPLPDEPQERSIDVYPGGTYVPLSFSIEMTSPDLLHPLEMTHNPLPDRMQERSIDVHPEGTYIPLSFGIEMRSPVLLQSEEGRHQALSFDIETRDLDSARMTPTVSAKKLQNSGIPDLSLWKETPTFFRDRPQEEYFSGEMDDVRGVLDDEETLSCPLEGVEDRLRDFDTEEESFPVSGKMEEVSDDHLLRLCDQLVDRDSQMHRDFMQFCEQLSAADRPVVGSWGGLHS